MPAGAVSCDWMLVASTNDRVEASNGVDRSYSFILSSLLPITNILVPSFENAMSRGSFSCDRMLVASTNIRVEASKGVDRSYSFTLSLSLSITNILVPSFENAMPVGTMSCDDMGVASTNLLVEASNGVDSVYSFTLSSVMPITNILAPSFENAMPRGSSSCNDMGVASTNSRVETSKGMDSVYSLTPLSTPITNILVPSLENAMPRGLSSWSNTSTALTSVLVETSKVPTIRLLNMSRTAPGSIVSSGVASPATAARCGIVRINEITVPSAAASMSSSPALKVMPLPV